MQRDHFIMHIEERGCSLVRNDRKGYSVYRSADRKRKVGVPVANKNGEITDVSICIACRELQIDVPLEVAERGIFELDENNMPKDGPLKRISPPDSGS